jgi:hypothetical protein
LDLLRVGPPSSWGSFDLGLYFESLPVMHAYVALTMR